MASTSSQPRRTSSASTSTGSSSHSHSTDDVSWQDYSSDNYQFLHQSNSNSKDNNRNKYYNSPSTSALYLSDDEYEERILSALARADNTEQVDTDSSDDWFATLKAQTDLSNQQEASSSIEPKKTMSTYSDIGDDSQEYGLEEEDAFLTKLRRFKEALTHSSAVNLTASLLQKQQVAEESDSASTARPYLQETLPPPSTVVSTKDIQLVSHGWEQQQQLASEHVSERPTKTDGTAVRTNTESLAQGSTTVRKAPVRPFAATAFVPHQNKSRPQSTSPTATTAPNQESSSKTRKNKPARPHSPTSAPRNKQQPPINQPPTLPLRTSATDKNNVSPWVRKSLSTRPKDCLLLVPRDYLTDNFNLARLAPVIERLATLKQKELEAPSPNLEERTLSLQQQQQQHQQRQPQKQPNYPIYRKALELILRQEGDRSSSDHDDESPVVQFAAEALYCLVHARFVVSPRGLDTIRSRMIIHGSHRINQPLFGRCPRLECGGMPLLPCGLSEDYVYHDPDDPQTSRAKRYCCHCRETFHFWDSKVQGCAWAGQSLCHLLLLVYGKKELFPSHFASLEDTGDGANNEDDAASVPPHKGGRIFGFRIHPEVAQAW